ncbi:T9SS type A sorting domain-containing protein [uncultured Aquimarina sp.]|uniref:T9SS type A sorting domain-containing protein n=1 Tax=uncultured Aquimarina sp. TaxID=575652 RepID=UPI002610ABD8|nr:T9SS type A sorting domain-containing protein [uncultured Aquimarina sp.]
MKKRLFSNYILGITLVINSFITQVVAQTQVGQDVDGEAASDTSGRSVSLSSNGNILAVGATDNDGNGSNSGQVRVFENVNDVWTQIGDDIDGEEAGFKSGRSISLSGDGTRVAIGGSNSGQVRVFERSSNTWIQLGQDIDEEAGDETIRNVKFSQDGTTLVVGAWTDVVNTVNAGRARVYRLDNTNNWVQLGADIYGESEGDAAGSISINGDGTIIAIGAQGNDGNGNRAGHARVFQWTNNTNWVQLGQDLDGEEPGDAFGNKLALNASGTIIAMGAEFHDASGNPGDYYGQVRVFEWDGNGSWVQKGSEIIGDRYSQSGHSLTINAEGNILAIGAPSDNNGAGSGAGYVRLYKWDDEDTQWRRIGSEIRGERALDGAGSSVALNSDGSLVAVGATGNDDNGNRSGNTRVFSVDVISPLGYSVSIDQSLIEPSNETNVSFTFINAEIGTSYMYSFSSSGDGNIDTINGSGTISQSNETVSGIDLSSLLEGTITLRVRLIDPTGNRGTYVTSTVLKDDLLSTQEFDAFRIAVYPNPTNGEIVVNTKVNHIDVYNLLGQKVFETEQNRFDISFLESGVYLIKIATDLGSLEKKISRR